jgi:hypothetical protein
LPWTTCERWTVAVSSHNEHRMGFAIGLDSTTSVRIGKGKRGRGLTSRPADA